MPKSAGAKASEKRRLARIKEEKRLAAELAGAGIQSGGAWSTGGAGTGSAGHQQLVRYPSFNKTAADIRKHIDSGGNPLEALELFEQTPSQPIERGTVESTIVPVLRALVQSGECAAAAQMLEGLKDRGSNLDIRQASAVLTTVSQRSGIDNVLRLVVVLRSMLVDSEDASGSALYFGHFADLLMRDFMSEVESGLDRLRGGNVDWLARMGFCMQQATVVARNGWNVEFRGRLPVSSFSWQKADTVVAMPLHWHWNMGLECWLEGSITDIRSTGFSMRVYPGEALRQGIVSPGSTWRVDKIANKVVMDRQIYALRLLCQGADGGGANPHRIVSQGVREVILAEAASWHPEGEEEETSTAEPMLCSTPAPGVEGGTCMPTEFFAQLNKSQQYAVHAALNRQVTLVQGPPGTGKTHTAVGLIEQWARCGLKPVLAACDSNAGVENIFQGVKSIGLECVRVGRSEAGKAGDGFAFLSGGLAPMSGIAAGGQTKDRDSFFAQQKKAMRTADVVCCTCAGAGADTLEKHSFQAILIDEASQATEPSVLIPICKGASTLALVGDHEQLPATVLNVEARDLGLERSLFDRLQSRGVEPQFLDVQYRMHPALSAFPSIATYGGRITSGVEKASRPSPAGFDWPVPHVPIAFVPAPAGREQQVGSSFCNHTEASALAVVVQQLLRAGEVSAQEVGVITPYQEQCKLLQRYLPRGVDCSSVDGFQGREKEVICVSTVRANPGGKLGFVTDRRRTNVTLTRARRGLIVVGHAATLAQDTDGIWGMWLDFAVKRGLVVGDQSGVDDNLMQELVELDAGVPLSGHFVGDQDHEPKRRRVQ